MPANIVEAFWDARLALYQTLNMTRNVALLQQMSSDVKNTLVYIMGIEKTQQLIAQFQDEVARQKLQRARRCSLVEEAKKKKRVPPSHAARDLKGTLELSAQVDVPRASCDALVLSDVAIVDGNLWSDAQGVCDGSVIFEKDVTCAAAAAAHDVYIDSLGSLEDCEIRANDHIRSTTTATFTNTKNILDAVRCVGSGLLDGARGRRGQGSNGADDNCDFVFDDCAEDKSPPIVHIDQSIVGKRYANVALATLGVKAAILAFDDSNELLPIVPAPSQDQCSVLFVVSVWDACGNAALPATVSVWVQSTGPNITFPANLTGQCFPSIDAAEAGVSSGAIITDQCTNRSDMTVSVVSTVTECNLRVRVVAENQIQMTGTNAVTVRVDTEAPLVHISQDQLRADAAIKKQPMVCFRSTQLAENQVLKSTAYTDNCTPERQLQPVVTSSNSGSPCFTTVTVSMSDSCGFVGKDSTVVRVDDIIPTLNTSVQVSELGPSNDGAMIDVGWSYTLSDNCGPSPLSLQVYVTTDDRPNGHPQAAILRNVTSGSGDYIGILLERAAYTQSGRVYIITTTATDACGNQAISTVQVNVLHSQGAPVIDLGQKFDATAPFG